MTTTVNQPSASPTNKVTATAAALTVWGIIVTVGSLALKNLAPEWYDPETIATISAGMPTVVAFITGWLTKDKPNVIVVMQGENP